MNTALSNLATLHRGILLDPSDDLVRLAYADALLEEGGQDDRAELIRVQVELALIDDPCDREDEPDGCRPFRYEGRCAGCRRRFPFLRREGELLEMSSRKGDYWFGLWNQNGVRRGFLGSIALHLAVFTNETTLAIFQAHPITDVQLVNCEPSPRYAGPSQRRHCWLGFDPASDVEKPPWLANVPLFIPDSIFQFLDGNQEVSRLRRRDRPLRSYTSKEEAHAALSRAAVQYGRLTAGLPPLPLVR